MQDLCHDHAGLPHALLQLSAQQSRHCLNRRVVCALGDALRQRPHRYQTAVRTPHAEALMVMDDRLNLGQFVDIVVDHRPRQFSFGQVCATVFASFRPIRMPVVHMVRNRRERSRVPRLAPPFLFSPSFLASARTGSGWVCRGRLGRVLRILAQSSLQLGDVGVSRCQFRTKLGDKGDEFVVCRRSRDLPIRISSLPLSSTSVNGYNKSSITSGCQSAKSDSEARYVKTNRRLPQDACQRKVIHMLGS